MFNFFKNLFLKSNKIRIGLINSIFWIIVILLLYSLFSDSEQVETGRILYIPFRGSVVEKNSGEDLLSIVSSGELKIPENTILKDVIFAINKAREDKKIDSIVLDLDNLETLGMASGEEIGNALLKFKQSEKKIYAYSSYYTRAQYYLASFADEIYMDPLGEVNIEGLSIYRNYWKNTFDKYDVDAKIFRAGSFKSYVEPYISTSMSDSVKEQNLTWMGSIWSYFTSSIKESRNLSKTELNTYFDNRLSLMKKYNGDSSLLAEKERLIDYISTREDFYYQYNDLYSYHDYIKAKKELFNKTKIGVLNLDGVITYSDNSPGSISAINIEALLDEALNLDLDGLIVRINSGGGGVFPSELIRRKLEYIRESVPVVISMGDVCASGGYWIATAGDTIYANNSTITGSIGVFSMILGFEETIKNNLGIITDGVSTTPNLQPVSATKNMSDINGEIIQLSVDHTYADFLKLVSESRDISLENLNGIAEGRVWSGSQALDLGLVDEIGGLNRAMESFGENIELIYLHGEKSFMGQLINNLNVLFNQSKIKVLDNLSIFEKINDPKKIYALWY